MDKNLRRYLKDVSLVTSIPFTVDTLGGVVTCEVSEDNEVITVDMGQVSFRSDIIPVNVNGEAREVLNEELEIDGSQLNITSTIGNPHCVVPVKQAEKIWP